ncbi:MAG TPA: DUF2314 domain-containing protein [Caulobacteraceae bacterium]|nr:DUF2314 domain-containing protein [Caulobacteraceae bacterium]
MRRLALTLATLTALAVTGAANAAFAQKNPERNAGEAAREEDGAVWYAAGDKAMNAAIEAARDSLPAFWRSFEEGRGDLHMLKVGLPTPQGGEEHVWVSNVTRVEDRFMGRLDNQPEAAEGYTLGQDVTFTEAQISDWGYERDGRLWGGYTLRVMLNDVPAKEAAEMRAYLSPTPLEAGSR